MIRPLIAALGVAALTSGPASAGNRGHLSLFPGFLYLLPPPMAYSAPAPVAGIDFITRMSPR